MAGLMKFSKMSSLMQLSKELPFSTSQGMILQSFSTNIKIMDFAMLPNHQMHVETPEVPLIACKMQLPSSTYVRWCCNWHFPNCGWDFRNTMRNAELTYFELKIWENQKGTQFLMIPYTHTHTLPWFLNTPS